jgi:hypothetical protein
VPPGQPEFEGIKVKVLHAKSLGFVGAVLALLMLFGKALLAAALVWAMWPAVFSPEFTAWVFGAASVPYWKVFLLMVAGSVVAKMLRPGSWGR